MPPRSDFFCFLDDFRSNCYDVASSPSFEFKPRAGTWASVEAWSQSRERDEDASMTSQTHSRRVRFANTAETQEYLHVSEYTPEEKQLCWYKRADYKDMRAHNNLTLDKMKQRMPLDEQEECHFGLEARTPVENMRSHQLMRSAFLAVLDEQEDQWRFDGRINHEVIAARYSSCTWEAQDRALHLGHCQSMAIVC